MVHISTSPYPNQALASLRQMRQVSPHQQGLLTQQELWIEARSWLPAYVLIKLERTSFTQNTLQKRTLLQTVLPMVSAMK